jgi:RimJ/RimL family protein N-acetyltransferase
VGLPHNSATVGHPTIKTARLLLRPFTSADFEPFAAMNADSRVMEFMAGTLTREQSDAFAARIRTHFDEHGYGLWAVQTSDAPFAGFIGLQWYNFDAHFTPALEVGFRLLPQHWNKGYATEGGKAAVSWAFANTDQHEVCSWTAVINARSQRVISKIGLPRDLRGDFEHPRVPAGNPLRPHVLFRVSREEWHKGPENKPG